MMHTAKFDLSVALTETASGLIGTWEYNTDLFDTTTIMRMIGHFQVLLDGIVADPVWRLADLPLLTESEQQQLNRWNETQTSYPDTATLHALFAAQAARTSDAVAVVFDDQCLSYRALHERANRLAQRLLALGVRPEVRVGICLERSPDLVIGLLGILTSGGAYVPLDPAYPPARLAFMLADAQITALVTHEALLSQLPRHTVPTVCLDALHAVAAVPSAQPITWTQPDHLAYVIYTSGSTGTPKGVAITHRSAAALVTWARSAFTPAQRAVVLAATSISFDLSVFELFVPLCWGGTLILVENVLYLPSARAAHMVTLINTVPSAIGDLVRNDNLPTSAHTINLAGEPLPLQLVQQLYQQPAIQQVVNLYGPSEDTTYSTWAVIAKEVTAVPTIGRPIANTQVYLLDRSMQPVPIGVTGELYIGGAGLARGYLNRPELTAERFVPNPFGQVLGVGGWMLGTESPTTQRLTPNTRLYRTGDRVRYLPDGNLVFLGRMDEQVKLRGFRIELGEIEAALHQHPAVNEVVVLAREDTPGEKRLVAYVVPNAECRIEKAEAGSEKLEILHSDALRAFLQQKLPDYMVPALFVPLDALPLTPNGKLDRRALPAPDATLSRSDAPRIAPRDSLELRLAQIWEELLTLRSVGVDENFFALGGHSLLAVRLLAQIERAFGRRLPLLVLFQNPTIAQLAQRLRQQSDTLPWSPLVALQTGGTRRPFFCVHPVSGSVLCYLELARALGPDQSFYGLQAAGLEGEQPPLSEVGAMAATYVAALQAVQAEGPYQLGGWSVGGVIAFEMARQLRAQGQEIALLALLDTVAPGAEQWRVLAAAEDAVILAGFVQDLAAQAGQVLDLSGETIEQGASAQQMQAVLAQAQALGVLPPDIGLTQIDERVAVFKANLTAVGSYAPPGAPCRILLFRASASTAAHAADPQLGWETIANEALEVIAVAGDHYTMVAQPHVQQLAERLRHYLAP